MKSKLLQIVFLFPLLVFFIPYLYKIFKNELILATSIILLLIFFISLLFIPFNGKGLKEILDYLNYYESLVHYLFQALVASFGYIQEVISIFIFYPFISIKETSIFIYLLYFVMLYFFYRDLYLVLNIKKLKILDTLIIFFRGTFFLMFSLFLFSVLYKSSFIDVLTEYLTIFISKNLINKILSFFKTTLLPDEKIIAIFSLIITIILEVYKNIRK